MKVQLLGLFYRKLRYTIYILALLPYISNAQTIKFQNENRVPVEGVSIFNNNNEFIGISDIEGKFDIKQCRPNEYLHFSLIGYKTRKLVLASIIKNNGVVILKRDELKLKNVIIIGRNQQYRDDIISETDIITQKEIRVTNPLSTADALAMTGNIFVQKSQFGGGSPVLRGFEANRILLVLDGVRMNNAIYRNGHLQNSITIDNFSLKRIEVIFGPGSLTYGSDAIGGVIHYKTKDPVFGINFSQYKFRYSSASNERTGFVGLNFGLSKFASTLILSTSYLSDLRAGSKRPKKYLDFGKRDYYVDVINGQDTILENIDYNIQRGTGYSQTNLLSKSVFKINNNAKLTANLQYSTSSNIPRYDFLTERKANGFKYSEWYYGPQTRALGSLRLDLTSAYNIYDNAVLIVAIQKIDEDRIKRKFKSLWKFFNQERLSVLSVSADFKKYMPNKNHEFVYGIDFQNNNLSSSAKRQNINTGELKYDILTRYPSNLSNNYRLGSYLQYVFGEKDFPFQISLGARIETNHISLKYEDDGMIKWAQSYYTGLNNDNTSYAYSLGGKYILPKKWQLSGNISSAFRNPNIDDLGKIRIKKGEILIPNLDLKPEKSNNIEISVKKESRIKNFILSINTTAFYTLLNNAIIRDRFLLPNGSDHFINENDTLVVMANQNIEKQRVAGVSFGLIGKINNFDLSANMVFTKGEILQNGIVTRPAAHIPPTFGNVKLGYKSGKFNAKYILVFNAAKRLDLYGGSVDNPENATVDGTYSWITHNIYAGYELNQRIEINLAIENIADIHYRSFSSGVSAPGRNLIFSVSGKIR